MQSLITLVALKRSVEVPAFWRSEDGQDLLEYGLLVALIAILAIGAVTTLGDTIQTVFWTVIAQGLGNNA